MNIESLKNLIKASGGCLMLEKNRCYSDEDSKEDLPELILTKPEDRVVLLAFNECGHNCTEVDLLDLVDEIEKLLQNTKP